jgi:hypothetical protein
MDIQKQIDALSAETLAFSIILGSVLSQFTHDRTMRYAISEAFDQAADVAQTVVVQFGKASSPEHSVKALQIVGQIRTIALGRDKPPKSRV